MHTNEIKITETNRDELMALAESLGTRHVEALKEQIKRQSEK